MKAILASIILFPMFALDGFTCLTQEQYIDHLASECSNETSHESTLACIQAFQKTLEQDKSCLALYRRYNSEDSQKAKYSQIFQ